MEEMNTTMNASEVSSWLSDLEMDEYNLFPEECSLNFFDADDEDFLSHDMASTLLVPTMQQQSLTSESTSTTLTNSFTDETSFDFVERPTKLMKTTIENETNIIEKISPIISPSPSSSSPSPSISSFQILSFDNPNSPPPNSTTSFYAFETTLIPKQNEVVSVSQPKMGKTQNPKGSSKNQNLEAKTSNGSKRSPAHAQDHIMAERKRREKLSQSFIALAALVPGLKKMDKASVLADAIKYVKELKERLDVLEEKNKNKKTKAESVVVLTKAEVCDDDDEDSSSCEFDESIESLFDVETRVSGNEMLIRIHCQKHKGLLVKIISEIQTMHLFVVNSSVLPFGDSILDITIVAQMGEEYKLSKKEVAKRLRMAALKFMS